MRVCVFYIAFYMHVYELMLLLLFLQSRSHLLRHAGHSRFKPFDVLHEQRERRRIVCHKKMVSQTSSIPAVGQEHCLSSHVQPSDRMSRSLVSPLNVPEVNGCESLCSGMLSIQSSSSSSDIVMDTTPSCHVMLGHSTCKNFGADILGRKANTTETFDKHLKPREEATTDTLKEKIADGGCVADDRFAILMML